MTYGCPRLGRVGQGEWGVSTLRWDMGTFFVPILTDASEIGETLHNNSREAATSKSVSLILKVNDEVYPLVAYKQ